MTTETHQKKIYFQDRIKENQKNIERIDKERKTLQDDIYFCQGNLLNAHKDTILDHFLNFSKTIDIAKINPDRLNVINHLFNLPIEYTPETKIKFQEGFKVEIWYKTIEGKWVEIK